jgi:hypothetical protein
LRRARVLETWVGGQKVFEAARTGASESR